MMRLKGKKVFVTGAAGFIGSHLVDALLKRGNVVTGIDDFSSGKKEFVAHNFFNSNFEFIESDLLKEKELATMIEGHDIVFHLAANPDVKLGAENTRVHLEQNIIVTYNILEAMRLSGISEICFTSTSTVYGEATEIPTAEDYGPLIPISLYAASKLGCEGLITSYAYTFGMRCVIYRFANVVGPRSTHGVTFDFVNKLWRDSKELEILGAPPGTTKSYFYISDCIDGMVHGYENADERCEMYNIGSEDSINVKRIADIVVEEMGLKNVKYGWTGGVDGGRGWKGDVRTMLLSIDKIRKKGWTPKYGSAESIRLTARHLIKETGTPSSPEKEE